MSRLGLVLAAVLTVAACSGSDVADAPVETTTPTATTPPPAPKTEATTTTTSVEPTTTVPETTTTFLEVEVPATDPPDPAQVDREAVFAEVFADYEEGWAVKRGGSRTPFEAPFEDDLEPFFESEALEKAVASLEQLGEQGLIAMPREDKSQRVELISGESIIEGDLAIIVICEVLTDTVKEAISGLIVFDDSLASRNRVLLFWRTDRWVVATETSDSVEEGIDSCDGLPA